MPYTATAVEQVAVMMSAEPAGRRCMPFRQQARLTPRILVPGGTGKTGRRVPKRLIARGLPVRIGSRSASPPFDWTDSATWPAAVQATTAAYVTFQPDLALPGAAEAVESFAALAAKSGVRHLVLLAGRGEEGAQRSEEVLRHAGGRLDHPAQQLVQSELQ